MRKTLLKKELPENFLGLIWTLLADTQTKKQKHGSFYYHDLLSSIENSKAVEQIIKDLTRTNSTV